MLVWEKARSSARSVQQAFALETPIDLDYLCEELGIRVQVGHLPNFSGLIIKEKGKRATIYLNEKEPPTRRRFTLAHELGHYFERIASDDDSYSFSDFVFRSNDDDEVMLPRGGEYNLQEFFADEFAGELLMPEEKFLGKWNTLGLNGTAEFFGVSRAAARKRHERILKSQTTVTADNQVP